MPFKSKAQIRWGREQILKGAWTQERFDEWMSKTPKNLPERVSQKKPRAQGAAAVKTVKTAKVIK